MVRLRRPVGEPVVETDPWPPLEEVGDREITPQTRTALEYQAKILELWALLGYNAQEERARDAKSARLFSVAKAQEKSGYFPEVTACLRALERIFHRAVQENSGLIAKIAKTVFDNYCTNARRGSHGLTLSDLQQEGTFAVRRSLDLFDPHRGVSFSTYLYPWLYAVMNRCVNASLLVHVPIFLLEIDSKVKSGKVAKADLRENRQKMLDLVHASHVSTSDLPHTKQGSKDSHSYSVGDMLRDERPSPEGEAGQSDVRRLLNSCASALTDREKEVLTGLFVEEETLQKVGDRLGYTKERMRQIKGKALYKLRRCLERKNVRKAGDLL